MRNSFLEPVAELDLAAKLLDAAADSLLIGDRKLTASLITLADRSEILNYTLRICSGLSDEVHRRTKLAKLTQRNSRCCAHAIKGSSVFHLLARWMALPLLRNQGYIEGCKKNLDYDFSGANEMGFKRVPTAYVTLCNGSFS